jgi:hypothetical protein
MSAFQVDCKDCSDAKARALATLLQLAAPELAGPAGGGQPTLTLVNNPQPAGGMVNMSPPKPVESAFSPAAAVPVSEPADASWPAGGGGGGGGVDAYVTRKGARVAAAAGAKAGMDANAAAALLGAALTGNPLFVKVRCALVLGGGRARLGCLRAARVGLECRLANGPTAVAALTDSQTQTNLTAPRAPPKTDCRPRRPRHQLRGADRHLRPLCPDRGAAGLRAGAAPLSGRRRGAVPHAGRRRV